MLINDFLHNADRNMTIDCLCGTPVIFCILHQRFFLGAWAVYQPGQSYRLPFSFFPPLSETLRLRC